MIANILEVVPHQLSAVYSFIFLLGSVVVIIVWYYFVYLSRRSKCREAELIQTALDDASDLIFVVNEVGTVVLCNKSFASFIRCDKDDILGKNICELFVKSVCEHFHVVDNRVIVATGKIRFELVVQTLNGYSMQCEVVLTSCRNELCNGLMYMLRDISEQNRIVKTLVKRDKLLYALSCGTQRVLDSSQNFEDALDNALEVFGKGAAVDAVIMAQSIGTNDIEGNSFYGEMFFKVKNIWAVTSDYYNYKDLVFEVKSTTIKFDVVVDQEKIVFVPFDQIKVFDNDKAVPPEIVGFYATAIYCQGRRWGILLLTCRDLEEKWDDETEEVIEISALQFGILLERRKAEESVDKTVVALKRSQDRLNMALKVAGAASFEYDLLLDKFDIDSTLAEKLEYGENWSIGSLDDIKAIMHNSDIERWHEKISALLNGDIDFITDDIRLMMCGGKYLWITMMASTIIENDVISGLTGVFQDIDEKMIRQNRLFNAEKLASVGELSTAIANNFNKVNLKVLHDLNHLADSGEYSTPKEKVMIKEMILALEGSVDIAKNLVSLSPKDSTEIKMIDINKLVEDIIGMVRSDFNDFGIDIKTCFDLNVSGVLCRSSDLMHVIVNLIINAKQAMERTKKKVLTVITAFEDEEIFISIVDTGCGVESDKWEDIFQPFYTTKDRGDAGNGTGLGLSVSMLLVKKYGGNIKLNSKVGKGSEFVIVLPAAPSEDVIDNLLPFDD